MDENIKEISEVSNLTKDIQERDAIIQDYINRGILDRNKVIDKIRELQLTDSDVIAATVVMQATHGYAMLERLDDNTLIENLQFQTNILKGKLIDKTRKNAMEESK